MWKDCHWFLEVTSYENHRMIPISISLNYNFYYLIFFQFKEHRIRKFSNDIDMWKLDFLREEKISECSSFVNKDVMQSWFNKSCFLKSMLLIKFPIWWYLNFLNEWNISTMLNKCIIWWFSINVTTISNLW